MSKKQVKFCYEIFNKGTLCYVVYANNMEGVKSQLKEFNFTITRTKQCKKGNAISTGYIEGYIGNYSNNVVILDYKRKIQ